MADEDTDDRLMEMLDQSVSPGKLSRSQSFRKKRKKLGKWCPDIQNVFFPFPKWTSIFKIEIHVKYLKTC